MTRPVILGLALALAGCGGSPGFVRVPPVDTTSLGVALERLSAAGLRVELTDFGPLPRGYTLRDAGVGDQDPEPGTRVRRGSVVRLNMHGVNPIPTLGCRVRHPPTVVVPAFEGLAWPHARLRLHEGFALEIVRVPAVGPTDAEDVLGRYVVVAQSPPAGTSLPYCFVRVGNGFRPTLVRLEFRVR